MADSTERPTTFSIVNVLKDAPNRAASDSSIRGLLAREDTITTREQVREVAAELVDGGVLEVVGRKGDGRRYRLIGGV